MSEIAPSYEPSEAFTVAVFVDGTIKLFGTWSDPHNAVDYALERFQAAPLAVLSLEAVHAAQ